MSAAPVASEPGLLFDWDRRPSRKFVVAGFVFGSIALHAICFYIFQVVYPPTIALLPPPARVSLITASTDEGRSLLSQIEAEDPALASQTQRPPDAKHAAAPRLGYVPSYVNFHPALRDAPPVAIAAPPPALFPPGPAPMSAFRAPEKKLNVATRLTFPEVGDWRAQSPPFQFAASANEPPQEARYRVAIDAAGVVRHALLDRSSGDAALDEQGGRFLLLTRMLIPADKTPPAKDRLVWVTASIEFGNDVQFPRPAGERAP